MGRTKSSGSSSHVSSREARAENAGRDLTATNSSDKVVSADAKLKDMLRDLHQLIRKVQDERTRSETTLTSLTKTHERMQQDTKVSQYYKTKLKGLYTSAMQDAESEADSLRKALDKIGQIKTLRENGNGSRRKQIQRRGVLMSLLQQNASTLPLWIGKPEDKPPALCGAVSAEPNYVARQGDKVAARVRGPDDEENWILAEVVSYNTSSGKYEVDDIDAEEGKERHTLSRRRIVPLPIWKANPETDPEALFAKDKLVLALYPQTTCFYPALIHEPPKRHSDDYMVLFEDTSYPDGYSPPLNVAQRYVIVA